MILEMHGVAIAEEPLGQKCGTDKFGTSANDLARTATELGFSAKKEHATLDEIRGYLAREVFPIVFINLLVIDGYNSTHAVVVEQVLEKEVKVIDPRMGERAVDVELFQYAWRRSKNVAVIVQKS